MAFPEEQPPKVSLSFCDKPCKSGCEKGASDIASQLPTKISALFLESLTVQTTIGAIPVKISLGGCLWECRPEIAAARVQVGTHVGTICFDSPLDLSQKLQEFMDTVPATDVLVGSVFMEDDDE